MATKAPRAGQHKTPPTDRITASFKNLVVSSDELVSATGDLQKVIDAFEKHLNSIKPHVATWHELSGNDAPDGRYWHRDIGYAKVEGRWGIALRDVKGYYSAPDDEDFEVWLFKDAPQWMQIETVGKLPDLLDAIVKRTQDTTKKLRSKTEEARKLAEALAQAAMNLNKTRK